MKLKREDILRETALVQLGLNRHTKSWLNILNYMILTGGLVIVLSLVQTTNFGAKGVTALAALATCNIVFIFLYTFFYSCRVISEEKQDKTMTLLRMTPVSEKNIFWGKVLPPFFNLLLIIVFQLPVIILTFTLGGVSISQIFLVYLLLILLAVLLTGMAAWVSADNPENWLSHFNYIFMLGGLFVLIVVMQLFGLESSSRQLVYLLNSAIIPIAIYDVIFRPGANILPALISNVFFILLIYKYSYSRFVKFIDFEEVIRELPKKKVLKSSRTVNFGNKPLINKEVYFGLGGRQGQVMIFLFTTVATVLLYYMTSRDYYYYSSKPSPLTQALLLCLFCLFLVVIYQSGNSIKKEKLDNTWSSLVLTPLKPSTIINHKILGNLKFIAPVFIVICLIFIGNFEQSVKDFKSYLKYYELSLIAPSALIFLLSAFVWLNSFEKPTNSLMVYILSSCSLVFVISAAETSRHIDSTVFIIALNLIFLCGGGIFYWLTIRNIEKNDIP